MKEIDVVNRRRRREHHNNIHQSYDDEGLDNNDENKGHRNSFGRRFLLKQKQYCLSLFRATYSTTASCTKQRCRYPREEKQKTDTNFANINGRLTILRLLPLLLLLGFGVILLTAISPSTTTTTRQLGRPLTDEVLNQIPVTIPVFDFHNDGRDIGGWKHLRRFFHPTTAVSFPDTPEAPDFGGLNITTVMTTQQEHKNERPDDDIYDDEDPMKLWFSLLAPPRKINPNDATLAFGYWEEIRELAYHRIRHYDEYPEDIEDEIIQGCRAPGWAKQYRPLCNPIHELSLLENYDKDRPKHNPYRYDNNDESTHSFYVSHGAYRTVWLVQQQQIQQQHQETSALKMARYKIEYDRNSYMKTLNDAVVMDKLTESPRIVEIYAHCGGSIWVEAMPHEMEEVIVPGEGMMEQKDLHDEDGLKPRNHYTLDEKIDMALIMAESLADLHGFPDGVIVHDDLQLAQWLRNDDGRIKLGDFNRAKVLTYDAKKEEYCRYDYGGRAWRFRAPEEYAYNMDEKIDLFSFGNTIYAILTGLWNFYDIDDDEVAVKKIRNGTRPYVDPRWKKRSYVESKMVEVMEQCWIHNSMERIDIFQVVKQLREIKEEHERRRKAN